MDQTASTAGSSWSQEIVSAGVFAMGGALAGLALLGIVMALVRAARVRRVKTSGGLLAVAAAGSRAWNGRLAAGGGP